MTRNWPMVLALLVPTPLTVVLPAHTAQAEAGDVGSTRALYLGLIRQARLDGKPRAALAYLDDFDRQYANDREAKVLRVNCLLDLGQVDAASTALGGIPDAARHADAQTVRGHVLATQGRWVEAASAYIAAESLSPADPFISNALGFAQLRAGDPQRAVETLKRAQDLAPDTAHGSAVVRNNLVLALTAAGRQGEATALLHGIRDTVERSRLQAQLAAEVARIAPAESASAPRLP